MSSLKNRQTLLGTFFKIILCFQRMENMLLNFKSDLGNISSEIISLQKKSVEMSQRLNNRQSVRGHLSQFIDDISVSEEHIKIILEADVTDKEFIKQLSVLSQKINFVRDQNTAGKSLISLNYKIIPFICELLTKVSKPVKT